MLEKEQVGRMGDAMWSGEDHWCSWREGVKFVKGNNFFRKKK
jgi:hypothetical protein